MTLLLCGPVFAQTQIADLCQTLQPHKPMDDANYKAGVDVNGNPVVPADINAPSFFTAGQPFTFPLTVDAAAYLGVPPLAGVEMKGNIGEIKVYPDGRVSFNGQDISQQVIQKCGTIEPASGAIEKPQIAEPQEPVDPNAIIRETLEPPSSADPSTPAVKPVNKPSGEEFFGEDGQEQLNE